MKQINIAVFAQGSSEFNSDGLMIKELLEVGLGAKVNVHVIGFNQNSTSIDYSNFQIAFFAQDFLKMENHGTQIARDFSEHYPNTLRITYSADADLTKEHKAIASVVDEKSLCIREFSMRSLQEVTVIAMQHIETLESNNDSKDETAHLE